MAVLFVKELFFRRECVFLQCLNNFAANFSIPFRGQ